MRLTLTTPALPVRDVRTAAGFYAERLGFATGYLEDGFARLLRDEAEIQLWQAGDDSWRTVGEPGASPVRSGAESFLAGTASCRVQVEDGIDALHVELAAAAVLHPSGHGTPTDTDWATREFAALDLDGNLITFWQRR
ncbi:MAG: VOC family protein [Actinobacteria bacterium]|uniref:Bleomycin resistance protein n=1 Tax=freshwater metagenome TaxID=449393 RepID=A0A6J6NTT1_9ZZZZ|nr:VOC family protein [Actinomycetota bacterium]